MKIQNGFEKVCLLFLPCVMLLVHSAAAQERADKFSCAEAQPEKACSASNTCGSDSAPCSVDVKRTRNSSTAEPDISDPKQKDRFCVKAGTTVKFHTTDKNTGFIVDFGPSSPFDPPGAVRDGSDRTVSVVAKRPGCFKYSAGACISGAIDQMCQSVNQEVVVIPGGATN